MRRVPLKRGKRPVAKRKGKIKPKGVSKLLKEADAVFSRFVRISGSDQNGIAECFTCGHRNHYKKLQNGHYISRFYKKYRFSENNCRIQCSMCNMWKSGDLPTFRQKLLKEIGDDLAQMESDYKEFYKLTPEYLQGIIDLYTAKLSTLERKDIT